MASCLSYKTFALKSITAYVGIDPAEIKMAPNSVRPDTFAQLGESPTATRRRRRHQSMLVRGQDSALSWSMISLLPTSKIFISILYICFSSPTDSATGDQIIYKTNSL